MLFKIVIFIIMVISFMLIFEKLVLITKACWKRIKPYVNSITAKKKKKVQEKEKVNLKKRFESKGWRIAK